MADQISAPIIVTGAAGFIGFHVTRLLLDAGYRVVGIDNMNSYYDVGLKEARLAQLQSRNGFGFERVDLAQKDPVATIFKNVRPSHVAHLAAQPGVRYSLENPHAYVDSNITGFLNILEGCRDSGVTHLAYASSSSVYGNSNDVPYSTHQNVDNPISLYAATKKSNELMAHVYSHLWNIPVTGLRFFTVYGPWGRPDMAAYLFTKAIRNGDPIKVFNNGDLRRDFTYVDDIANGVVKVLLSPPQGATETSEASDGEVAPLYRLYNIGNSEPVELLTMIKTLEKVTGQKAVKEFLPMQPGDVYETYADTSDLERDFGFKVHTPLEEGLTAFVDWYDRYHSETGGK
ncbi:NAD-dependent epimerase/dehydratase family protein [Hoeflea prorocentri]|uniref:GDP-mannose 4,6-dehydratase n=1 Tax=Hoeflea prorocentri TaxID=1922333 RepID=A0A9X3UKW5_9HYPH|nr:NAD-dependent epimerase/dehydratase family protein [Hoeflea prorocentri]MCY6380811.1 GDP-mannose 4,6-dehydratase [Hoeflea prorocentri]MDA5398611.1 GDP-mannose 4,6-dehydratase [Hoeflea prorocentri]